jgi:hypothetical protein
MPALPDGKQLAALREKYGNPWPEVLSTLVGFAGVRLGSGKAEEEAPILDEARAILLMPVKKGSQLDEATGGVATLACAYVAAVGQGAEADASTKMKELLEKIAFSPAYRTPGRHYSSPQIMVIEAIVLGFSVSGR